MCEEALQQRSHRGERVGGPHPSGPTLGGTAQGPRLVRVRMCSRNFPYMSADNYNFKNLFIIPFVNKFRCCIKNFLIEIEIN